MSLKDLKNEQRMGELQEEIRSLNRRLEHSARIREEYFNVVRDAVATSLLEYRNPKLRPAPVDRRSDHEEEVAICILSDWQLSKITPTYNSDVCAKRIDKYVDKVRKIIALHRKQCPVKKILVLLLGDLIEGELIFPGQSHLVDSSLYTQVMVTGPRILSKMILELAQEGSVRVNGVIGNHGALGGRARKDYHPESNADSMLYEVARLMVGDQKRVSWAPNIYSGERKWYATEKMGKYNFMLFHGDQVKGGFAGFPWYGFSKKLLGWSQMSLDGERFDYAVSGHFHTPVRMYINGITCWGNGSTESTNTYAAEQLGSAGTPCQWLLFCRPDKGVTAEYLIHLGEEKVYG